MEPNTLLKYVQAFMMQTAQTAIANARARIDERLARWILMADDRIRDKTLPLTHEFLAPMLGVRRAGVTRRCTASQDRNLSQRVEVGLSCSIGRELRKVPGHFTASRRRNIGD